MALLSACLFTMGRWPIEWLTSLDRPFVVEYTFGTIAALAIIGHP